MQMVLVWISWQWNRDGVAIAGATGSTYTLVQADVGAVMTVTASYTDGEGTPESVTSESTSAVENVSPCTNWLSRHYGHRN